MHDCHSHASNTLTKNTSVCEIQPLLWPRPREAFGERSKSKPFAILNLEKTHIMRVWCGFLYKTFSKDLFNFFYLRKNFYLHGNFVGTLQVGRQYNVFYDIPTVAPLLLVQKKQKTVSFEFKFRIVLEFLFENRAIF